MKNKNKALTIDQAFIQALSNTDDYLKGTKISMGELLLDEVMDNELLKPLPIVSFVHGIYKTGKSVQEAFFTKKVIAFFSGTSNLGQEKRKEFAEKMNKDRQFKDRVIEKTIVILDRMDELNKVELLANLFKNLALDHIDMYQYSKLCSYLDRVFVEDLDFLVRNREEQNSLFFEEDIYTFTSAGLVGMRPELDNNGEFKFHYENTQWANDLLDFALKDPLEQK
ncbi:MAG: hypothetical protein AAF600_04640 [Bacteroidota bacterium]